MSNSKDEKSWSIDYPNISEGEWYALAIAGAVITFVLAIICLLWVIAGLGNAEFSQRLSIAGMITTFCGVATTFCTVAWRGMITTRQVDVANQQISATRRQISVTEDNNLAVTLQKGAELIEDPASAAKVSAGLASLHSVMLSGNREFSLAAQSLLLEFVIRHGWQNHTDRNVIGAIDRISNYYKKNLVEIIRSIKFSSPFNFIKDGDTSPGLWRLINGVYSVHYSGGYFYKDKVVADENCELIFSLVRFENCTFTSLNKIEFDRCFFHGCLFLEVDTLFLANNVFKECNFSSSVIKNDAQIPNMKANNNYYNLDTPPNTMMGDTDEIDWKEYFIARS